MRFMNGLLRGHHVENCVKPPGLCTFLKVGPRVSKPHLGGKVDKTTLGLVFEGFFQRGKRMRKGF